MIWERLELSASAEDNDVTRRETQFPQATGPMRPRGSRENKVPKVGSTRPDDRPSTRPIDEFIALLHAHGVSKLVDVRTVPRSRHNPQFNRDQLPASLNAAGIAYHHEPVLGGLRKPSPQSPNMGWRNLSFRGYADHMQTPGFQNAVERLIADTQRGERLALMCAEAVPWRCHRSLVADALLVRGMRSEDIRTATTRMPHRITRFAQVRGTTITYPSDDRTLEKVPSVTTRRRADSASATSRSRTAAGLDGPRAKRIRVRSPATPSVSARKEER